MAIGTPLVGAMATNATTGPITPATPAGIAVGDVKHLWAYSYTAGNFGALAGWELLGEVDHPSAGTAVLYRRVHQAGDANPSLSGFGNGIYGNITAYPGASTTTPEDVTVGAGNTGSGTTLTAPSVTTAMAGSVAAYYFAQGDNNTLDSPTGGATLTFGGASYSTTVGGDCCLAAAYETVASPGTSGTCAVTASGGQTNNQWVALTVAIRDAAAAVDVTAADTNPAGVTVGSPSGESVEALSINVDLVDPAPAGTALSSPAGEVIDVTAPDTAPVPALTGSPSGETVGVSVLDTNPAGVAVGSPSGESVTAEEPGLPAGGAPFVSLWGVHPTTGALVHLPHALKVDLSPIRNSGGSFRFDYPAFGKNFEFLHDRLVNDKVAVELQLWVGGSRFNSLGGDVLQVEGDDVAEDSVWSFSGKFFTHRLARATVRHDPAHEKGERRFSSATAGTIMRTFLLEAQARGTLTYLDLSTFSATHDSAGVPWSRTATLSFTPYGDGGVLTVLSRLVALGMCEGEVDRDKRLLLYNAGGAGRDLTTRTPPVILRRAKDLLESNRRLDVGESGTDVYGTGGEGLYASAYDASARARWGEQIEMVADSNQIKDQGALTAFVQNARDQAVLAPMELTHGLVFGTNRPAPVSGFRINDWLYSDVGRGLERVRVAQWVLSQDVSGIKGSVTLNDIIADRLTRLQRQIAAMADGSAVVGTSTASPVNDTMPPAAPTGLVVDSNIAYQVPEHTNTLAELIVGWAPVTTNADGSATDDVDSYRVQYTYLGMDRVGTILDPGPGYDPGPLHWIEPSGSPTRDLFLRFGDVEADAAVAVRVAAIDRTGNQSAWSASLELTTAADDTAPEAPSAPGQSIWFRTLDTYWDGLDFAGAPMPADFDHVAVLLSQAASFSAPMLGEPTAFNPAETGVQHVANLYGPGTWNQPDLPIGVGWYSALVAVDRAGNPSAMSAIAGPATAERLVQIDIGPNAVGQQQIIDLEVVRAKIGNAAINSLKVEEIAVGLVTTGTLTATVTLTGIIQTATTGLRWRGDTAGIRFWNSSNQLTIDLRGDSGNVLLTGTMQSALSGERWMWLPDGTLRLYPAAGTNYNAIYNEGGGGLIFRSGFDGSNRAGYLYLRNNSAQISYGTPGTLIHNSRLQCSIDASELWGGQIVYRADRNFGTVNRHVFTQFEGSADVTNTVLYLRDTGGTGQFPWFHSIGGNSGLIFGPNYMAVVNNDANLIELRASNVAFPSSRRFKRAERAIGWTRPGRPQPVTPLDVIDSVEAKEWEYLHEVPGYRRPSPGKITRRTVNENGQETFELVDGEWSWPEPAAAPKHYGPMAEDLALLAPDLVRADPTDPTQVFTDVRDLLGVLWEAVRQLNQKVNARPGRANEGAP